MSDAVEVKKPKKTNPERNKGYAAASQRLRLAHHDEFMTYLEEEYAKIGVAPRRRRTQEEIDRAIAAKAASKAEREEMRRQDKIARLEAQIADIKQDSAMAVFSEA